MIANPRSLLRLDVKPSSPWIGWCLLPVFLSGILLMACGQPVDEGSTDRDPVDRSTKGEFAERAEELNSAARALYEAAEGTEDPDEKEQYLRRAIDRYEQALIFYQKIEPRFAELRTARLLAVIEIYKDLARIHRAHLDDYNQAIEHYRSAEGLESVLADKRMAFALNNRGRAHFELGEMDEALALWQRARELAKRAGDRKTEASSIGNLALIARYSGDMQKALDYFEASHEIFDKRDDYHELATTKHNRGRILLSLGEQERADADFEEALALFRAIGGEKGQAVVLTRIGKVQRLRGQLDDAHTTLEEALRLRQRIGAKQGEAVALFELARVLEDLGETEEALSHFRRSLEYFESVDSPRAEARARLAIGNLSTATGETAVAREVVEPALETFRQLGDPAGEIDALFAIARLERATGDLASASERMEEVLERLEDVRRSAVDPDLRSTYLASRFDLFDFAIDTLMALHAQEPSRGHDRRAFDLAERARARSLLDLLVENREAIWGDADPNLIARELQLTDRINQLESKRIEAAASGQEEAADGWGAQVDQALRELRRVQTEIRQTSPRFAALTQPTSLRSEQIQARLLGPGTVLLSYHLGAENSFLWLLTPSSFSSYVLASRDEIESMAEKTIQMLRLSEHSSKRLQAEDSEPDLGQLLLGPVAEELGDQERLLIEPSGMLHRLPFGALALNRNDGSEPTPLVDAYEIVVLPSVSALDVQRRLRQGAEQPPIDVAVIGDPIYSLSDPRLKPAQRSGNRRQLWQRLGHAGDEIDAMASHAKGMRTFIARGAEATREVVESDEVGQSRYVHFAVHGSVDTERPELSKLVFSLHDATGTPQEGELHAYEVFNLDLNAELVTLSACETGLGKAVRGEGLVGLTQGFLYAGAERVLVSLWRVDDEATAALMDHFYRHLLKERMSPAAALRAAQRALRAGKKWQAPYHWAGFALQGEWRWPPS